MADAITLKQWGEWLKNNTAKTWYLPTFGQDVSCAKIKYFDLGFDTRTMEIYYIKARGSFQDDIIVHVGDDNDCFVGEHQKFPHLVGKQNTLLDLLDDLIERKLKRD